MTKIAFALFGGLAAEEVGGGGGEGVVEVGAVGIGEGAAEEFIDADALAATFFKGAAANIPAMQVQGDQPVGEARGPDGIEPAGDRLDKPAAAGHVRALDCAEAREPRRNDRCGAGHRHLLEARIDALLGVAQEGGDQVAVAVHFKIADLGEAGAGGVGEQRSVGRKGPFELLALGFLEGRAAVAHNAAGPAAMIVITAEKLRDDLR